MTLRESRNMIALDCGNSSFRIVLGRFNGKTIQREVIDQYPNEMIRVSGYDYWDMLRIFSGFKASLRKAAAMVDRIDSIGVCTWGVDFALYDREGNMLGNPLAYRNTMGAEQMDRLAEKDQNRLFSATGILCDKINSIYMLMGMQEAMPSLCKTADKLLMIPDILHYMLTGRMHNEPSELSTTQMMNVRTKQLSQEACEIAGVSSSLFSPPVVHGEPVGMLSAAIRDELGIPYDIPVIGVPSHDTACAVLAVPACEEHFAFISSGTWSLIGTELAEPVISDQVRDAGLTNEAGAFGTITLLKNSAGMFLLQRIRKEYELAVGRAADWDELDRLMDAYDGPIRLFPVNDKRFFNPVSMSGAIGEYLRSSGQAEQEVGWGALLSSVYHSLACGYALTIEGLENATEHHFDTVYIVGGGSKNFLLNGLTADRTGKTVIACDKESTALGNLICQLRAFQPQLDMQGMRRIVRESIERKTFAPRRKNDSLTERYRNECEHG